MSVDPSTLTTAVFLTALTVVGMGAAGFVWSKDLAGWARPLSLIVLAAVVVSIVGIVVGGIGALSPVISIIILVASAALILVDFNYVRKHATEGRRDLAGHGHLRLDHQHLHQPAEPHPLGPPRAVSA